MDTLLQRTQLTRSEMIHKLVYLFHTGAKQLSSLTQVCLKTFLSAENITSEAIFKAI